MGCKQSTVIPIGTEDTSHKSQNAEKKEKTKSMLDLKISTERPRKVEKKNLQQLGETYTSRESSNYTGVNDHECMPPKLEQRNRPTSFFSPEEKNLIADILKKQKLTAIAVVPDNTCTTPTVSVKQERSKQRRAERQRKNRETFYTKRKFREDRLRKLEKKRKEMLELDRLTEALLKN